MGTLHRTPIEVRLLETANRQQGLLRYDDLIALGLLPTAIQKRKEDCRLTRIHDQVYALGHTALRDEALWLAALWTCAADDALSHFTAAAFHGWRLMDPAGMLHVSTLGSTTSREDLKVHRVRRMDPIDIFRPGLFRVTSIPRTLVDLADVMPWKDFRTLADAQSHLRVDKIREAQLRAPGRAGRGRVTRLIEADDAHTKSEFERRFLLFLDTHQVPRPDGINVRVAGHTADCRYLRQKVVVELDGRAFHRRRSQMRSDRQRDGDYQLAGYRILRLVWDDLHPDDARQTADRLRGLLALAPV
jgi:hypothetical protein